MTTQIDQILKRLAELVTASGQDPALAANLENHARKLEMAAPGSAGRVQELGTIRSLYSMGMGGWMDVVLQDKNGVLPIHDEFDDLCEKLFEAVSAEMKSGGRP